MPVQNELQYRYNKQMGEIRELYPPVIEAILARLAEGDTVADAVDTGFKEAFYEQQSEEMTVNNTIGASQSGLGEQLSLNLDLAPDYYLYTKFADGVNLSDTLHSVAANQWLVDGITLFIAHDTVLHGEPFIDSEVHVVAYRLLENHFIARIIEEIPP